MGATAMKGDTAGQVGAMTPTPEQYRVAMERLSDDLDWLRTFNRALDRAHVPTGGGE